MLNDIRHACRLLIRQPGFTVVACLTLALGIGTNSAIFAVVDAALFKPLPYQHADRLVEVWSAARTRSGDIVYTDADPHHAPDLRGMAQVFDGVDVLSYARPKALEAGSDQNPLVGGFTPTFPSFVGVGAHLGRTFADDDVRAGHVAVISDGYWQRAFGRDPSVIGKPIAFADQTRVVVGVMPPTFRYLVGGQTDVWLPISERDGEGVVARVRPGLTVDQAQHELNVTLAAGTIAWKPIRIELHAAGSNRADATTKAMLFSLFGAVGLVLLIACANVANLLLSRTLARSREIAVRSSLGATRLQLVRQFLIEGLVLAALSGVMAMSFAWWGLHMIPRIAPSNLVSTMLGTSLPALDGRVLAFALFAVALTGVLSAAMPAIRASRGATSDGLLGAGQRIAGTSRTQRHLRDAFQVMQVAMTLVLLVGAGLLVTSFVRMVTIPTGFDSEHLLYVTLKFAQSDLARRTAQYAALQGVVERLSVMPQVVGATLGSPPSSGSSDSSAQFVPEGLESSPDQAIAQDLFYVSADYFSVAGIPLEAGRTFRAEDAGYPPLAAIISENAARRIWPGETAIGKRFTRRAGQPALTVVGVVGHVTTLNAAKDGVEVYLPAGTSEPRGLLVRVTGDPSSVVAAVRAEVKSLGSDVALLRVGMADRLFAEFDPLGSSRFYAVLMGLFAVLGLATAAIGLYGMLSYAVARRTHEIGVRLALGAALSRVRWLVIADALIPVAMGIVVGLVTSWGLTRYIASQLFQVKPHDPLTLVVVVVLFLVVAGAAAFVPVQRASRVDPVVALRAE